MATEKQKRAFDKIAENHGNISKTMREVGYSNNTAKKPSNLTDSDGWRELMETHLPDSLLAKRHKELLNKKEFHRISVNGEEEMLETPETQAVTKGLDMAYKLKGRYAPEKGDTTNVLIVTDKIKEIANELRRRIR